jgi:hypothetical protein
LPDADLALALAVVEAAKHIRDRVTDHVTYADVCLLESALSALEKED